mmetsp:Transcript_102154/g.256026  ORF Transcript_102154/g.256026 Transcript_102154/m.256026 type:complete len:194 (-) Transcript_102154:1025-1606(-)
MFRVSFRSQRANTNKRRDPFDECLIVDDEQQEIGWFMLESEAKAAGQHKLDSALADLLHPPDWGKFEEEFGLPPIPTVQRCPWQQSWDSSWRLVVVVIEEFPLLPGYLEGELDVRRKFTVEVERFNRSDIDEKLEDLDCEIARLQQERARLLDFRRVCPPDAPPSTHLSFSAEAATFGEAAASGGRAGEGPGA